MIRWDAAKRARGDVSHATNRKRRPEEHGSTWVTRHDQEGWVWQAEEVVEAGRRVRYYGFGPFPKVQFLVIDDVVESIIVTLQQPVAIETVAKDLSLTAFESAPLPDESRRVLGIAFPERGVLFAFSPDAEADKITQIVLEPITSEPFVYRAEYDARHRYTQNLTDLNFALKIDPQDAKAHWLRARILTQLNDHQAALADIERAVKMAPNEPRYRLTRALLLGEIGKYDEAIRETRAAAQMKDASPLL